MHRLVRPIRLVAAVAAVSLVFGAFGTSTRAADDPAKPAKEPKPAAQKATADKPPEKKPEKKDETFLDPEKAGLDYKLQGEYAGDVGGAKLGVQVIALGGSKFHAVFLPGGLPGDGWDGKTKVEVDGKGEGEQTTFERQGLLGGLQGRRPGRQGPAADFEFKRVVRRSPTEGAKPPAGAIVLFDGTNADALRTGKMDERRPARASGTHQQAEVQRLHAARRVPAPVHAQRPRPGPRQQRRLHAGPLRSAGARQLRPEGRRTTSAAASTPAAAPDREHVPPAAGVADLRHRLHRRPVRRRRQEDRQRRSSRSSTTAW